jgi:hypothetical protein
MAPRKRMCAKPRDITAPEVWAEDRGAGGSGPPRELGGGHRVVFWVLPGRKRDQIL